MKKSFPLALLTLLLFGATTSGCSANPPRSFDGQAPVHVSAQTRARVEAFIQTMVKQHRFSAQALTALFDQVQEQPDILRAIARPAESKPWYAYRPIFLTASRIRDGVAFWKRNAATLARASKTYGVPPGIIVAIIGVETRYGQHTGRYRVIDALSTLAFAYPPRSAFFKKELAQFLLMTREEHLDPLSLKGSYAGAMGQPQFIPSSFRHYAVDFDGDGVRDLWHHPADAIGSVGNYFQRHGWVANAPVVSPAQVSGQGYRALQGGLKPQWTAADFKAHGVRIARTGAGTGAGTGVRTAPAATAKGALIALETRTGPAYWIGWQNFYVITRYNHSPLYAMAVYQLSQAIHRAMHETRDEANANTNTSANTSTSNN